MTTRTTDEIARMRTVVEALEDARLKSHILEALDSFVVEPAPESAVPAASDDSKDSVVQALRAGHVTTRSPRDALFLAVHGILLETGFKVQNTTEGDALALPANWDTHSETGLLVGTYTHEHAALKTFRLQGLFVGNTFQVYLSDDQNHTHSMELSVDNYIALNASSGNATDVLRDLAALRLKLTPFLKNAAPPPPPPPTPVRAGSSPQQHQPRTPSSDAIPSPYVIPPVGSGDLLPPGLGGGDPSTHVGPNHPMFGRRYDPTHGSVPGARFDPFGPFSTDPLGPPRGFVGRPHPMRPGPSPGFPLGEPNPDHLRMPGDDDLMEDPFGPRRGGFPGRGQGSGGGGFGSNFPPHGSDHSFF